MSFHEDILLEIFFNCEPKTILKCSLVCKYWNHVSKLQILWMKNVLKSWPSQQWLYGKASVSHLNWMKVYQELFQYLYYTPDQMKYFVTCNTFENELISPILRKAMFEQVEYISQKWLQTSSFDQDDKSQVFDKNMELYFNIKELRWVFLDKRRGYMSDLFPHKKKDKFYDRICNIRAYQVIPSCLLMYRWLCIFRVFLTAEIGLTFYRIWRFRLKHYKTGLIFELCDWKAGMSSTFAHGSPAVDVYREDCLELLQLLTHPHFIMHPLGLNSKTESLYNSMIRASAGGCMRNASKCQKRKILKQKETYSPTKKKSPLISPTTNTPFMVGSSLDSSCFVDLSDRLEKWRVKRKQSLLKHSISSLNTDVCLFSKIDSELSSASSDSSLNEIETEEHLKENNAESDIDLYDGGYILNCEYYISSSQHTDSIEEQHNLQATIAEYWALTQKEYLLQIPVVYDIEDDYWYFQPQDAISCIDTSNATNKISTCVKQPETNKCSLQFSENSNEIVLVDAIPSALMLYRLICLFELNCNDYNCLNDTTVWKVSMVHKRSGGIIHFKDYNGYLKIYVSVDQNCELNTLDTIFEISEFRDAVTQLLALLMDEKFCHPYGTIAGSVA
ncbi:uncharacterized protein LOC136071925 isoform X1 [Hydra vulgaris]|uniref:Uncharacterized protein LOC136071925 isoform X1 n=2 Tax=Hydra vulgaris TaxID=6087 RepID=A0ABM4BX76_HYDVU